MPTSIHLLGPLAIRRQGAPLPLGRRRERCLLGILLLHPGVAVPRDRLIDLLWDDEPPPSAASSLHTSVSRVRSALRERFGTPRADVRVCSRDGGYAAEVDPAAVDAHRFRQLISRACAACDPRMRADLLLTALALWRGPVLAKDAWPRLRDRVAAEFAELRLQAVTMLAEAKLECGRQHELVADLTALTAEYPTHEPLVRQLMLALCRCGRPAEAVHAYERSRRRLSSELGVDPAPDLQRLHVAILRQDAVVAG